MGYSIVLKTSKGRFEHQVEKNFVTLGRSKENEIPIDDLSVSRKHAVVEREEDTFFITDLNSSNGTYVNSTKITEKTPITPEDIIIVGRVHFSFRVDEEDEGTVRMSREEMASVKDGPNATNPVSGPRVEPQPAGAAPPPPPVTDTVPEGSPPPQAPPQPAAAAPPPPPPVAPQPEAAAPPPPPMESQPHPAYQAPPQPAPAPRARPEYAAAARAGETAGFWIRLGAYFIDVLILMIPMWILMTIIGKILWSSLNSMALITTISLGFNLLFMAASIAYIVIGWSRFGTTVGKAILGLYVIDEQTGQPPTLGKAFLRLVGYMVSSIILYIGFLMIAFQDDRKGLHDKIAGTRVVKR